MIRGLELFREHFGPFKGTFVLIGGVACHEWLATQGREFRATKDMDMVLIAEALDAAFVKRFWEFIEAGKYQARFKADDGRQLYRWESRSARRLSRQRPNVRAQLPGEYRRYRLEPHRSHGYAGSESVLLIFDDL